MTEPVRLQLSRAKGFNLQEASRAVNGLDAVSVARPSMWGNPWSIRKAACWYVDGTGLPIGGLRCGNEEGARLKAVQLHRQWIEKNSATPSLEKLRGKNLACWCKPGEPCHADVLLELANRPVCEEVT